MKKKMDASRVTPSVRRRAHLRRLCEGAVIAALYVALTWLSATVGLASGPIQVRISEALCVLTLFTPAAIPGLTIGCLLANLTMGSAVWDIVFGSLATLLGALGGYAFGWLSRRAMQRGQGAWAKACKWLSPMPTVLANTVIVPWVLRYAYSVPDAVWFLTLTVGLGELISAWVLGIALLLPLERKKQIFL